MIKDVGVGAGKLRNDVPTLARATLYNVLEVGQDTTGAVIGAVLFVVGEGDKMLHKVAHNPFEGGFVALDYDMLIDVLHKAKNYRVKLLKIRGLKIPVQRATCIRERVGRLVLFEVVEFQNVLGRGDIVGVFNPRDLIPQGMHPIEVHVFSVFTLEPRVIHIFHEGTNSRPKIYMRHRSKNYGQKLREQVSPNGQGRHGQEEKTKVTPMEHKGHEADGEQDAEIVPADESKYLFHI